MSLNQETSGSLHSDQLQQLVDEHPYYALGQLDLLRSFDSNRTPAFHQQAAKTALFFSNTYWLSWQLHPGDVEDDQLSEQEESRRETQDASGEPRYVKDEEPIENTPVSLPPIEVNVPHPVTEEKSAERLPSNVEVVANVTSANEQPAAVPTEEIAFEPLHTVDYFASQGIKLTEEPISNDKLGKQLKSFTEWLKSMKKVHSERLPVGDEYTDRRIQSIANESNSQAEVLTEAMAEVYLKQDKTDKAIEVYSKLSLINPSKSAYFAAKIESLKAN